MNEKRKARSERGAGGLKHKGFYAALYSCVGVMLVLAVVIGYANFGGAPGTEDPGPIADLPSNMGLGNELGQNPFLPDEFGNFETAEVSGGREDSFQQGAVIQPDFNETGTLPTGDFANEGSSFIIGDDIPDFALDADLTEDYLEAWRRREREASETETPSPSPEPTPEPTPEPPKEEFRSFNEHADSMAWPVLGDIVMNYSVNHLIYDKTLEQYRTNDNICIGARQGTPVGAAADGKVKEVFTTRESGRTVVVDHGNGWHTTYSQLQDDILVKVGDVVSKNQSIGSVGNPTLYSSQLGSHLAFSVTRDSKTVDPNTMLK